jgi:tetratricopeptide (TPR) repeat protein
MRGSASVVQVGSAVLALVIGTLLLYAPCSEYEFLNFDDDVYVTRNAAVRSGLNLEGFKWAMTTFHAANWHPLTWLSLQFDASLSHRFPGRDVRGQDGGNSVRSAIFHLTNLLLHVLATVFLFLALYLLTGDYWPSALTAALFAWHPLHVESVSWVAERKDVLSAVFWMLTLLAYAWYVRRPGWQRYLAVILSLALGLMAKPMLVTLPAVLLVLDYWPLRRIAAGGEWWNSWKALVLEKLPLFVLAAAASIVTWLAQAHGGTMISLQRIPLGIRLENALFAYAVYIGKTALPVNLAPLYPYPYAGYSTGPLVTAVLLLIILSVAFIGLSSRRPYLLSGWFWFLGTLVPVIGIVQVGIQSWADRYTYIPLIGLMIIVSWSLADLATDSRLRPAAATIGVGLLIGCALGTHRQLTYWRSSLSLWQHAVKVTPRCADAYNNLGYALATTAALSQSAGQQQLSQAIDTFRQGLVFEPGHPKLLNNLGRAYAECDRLAEAERCYRQALAAEPTYIPARYNLGRLLLDREEINEAAQQLRRVLELQPDNAGAHFALGRVLGRQKKYAAALAELRRGYLLDPDRRLNAREKRDAASIEAHRQIELDPNNFGAHVRLGEILLSQDKGTEALEHFQEAHRLRPDDPAPVALIKQAQVARP